MMIESKTDRNFQLVLASKYPPDGTYPRLLQASSAIGDYEDSMEKPGSSFLWVGEDHHLDREGVSELVVYLQTWLSTGYLY